MVTQVTDDVMAPSTANTLAGYNSSGNFAGVAIGSGLSLSGSTLSATSGGVSSFTGDSTILSNFASTGAVTATLANAAAGTVLGNATSSSAAPTYTSTPQLGKAGTLGSLTMGNATSGLLTLQPATGALGTVTVSIPAATDTLVNLTGTQTLTNKTLTSPTLTTPALGTPASGNLSNCTNIPVALMTPLAVGSIIYAANESLGTLAANATTAASNLGICYINYTASGSLAAFTPSGDSITGTWKALQTVITSNVPSTYAVGLFQRTV